MMMLNVSQMLAKANHEKMRLKILYCKNYQVLMGIATIVSENIPGPARAGKTCG